MQLSLRSKCCSAVGCICYYKRRCRSAVYPSFQYVRILKSRRRHSPLTTLFVKAVGRGYVRCTDALVKGRQAPP